MALLLHRLPPRGSAAVVAALSSRPLAPAAAAVVTCRRRLLATTNGAPPPSDEPAAAGLGGWYSADSVERRLRKQRPRPPSGVGRTAPQPSEEDHWLRAGAYDALLAAPSAPAAAAVEPSSAAAAAAAVAAAPAAAATWAPLPHSRVSTGTVLLGNLGAFIRAYELVLVPMYQACDGFQGAQLLVRDLPPGATRGGLLAAATGAGRSSEVTVQSVTQWRSAAALEAAQELAAYGAAMQQLRTLFHASPQPSSWALVSAAGAAVADGSPAAAGPAAAAAAPTSPPS